MKLLIGLVLLLAMQMGFSETLNEAIENSIFSNAKLFYKNDSNKYTNGSSFSQLNLSRYFHSPIQTKADEVSDKFMLKVVNRYLVLVLGKKLMQEAKANLEEYRAVFAIIKRSNEHATRPSIELNQLSQRLTLAQINLIKTEAMLREAKINYAKVVGHWPDNDVIIQAPQANELPSSVSQAIEEGLINYPTKTSHYSSKNKSHSMIDFSETIRLAWKEWTSTHLKLQQLRERMVAAEKIRSISQKKFKEGKETPLNFLDAQKAFYQAEVIYAKEESKEIFSRYQLLSRMGKLLPYVTKIALDNQKENMFFKSEIANLSDRDYFYPSYKPLFRAQIANMELDSLPASSFNKEISSPILSNQWYVSAGNFKNNANAIALVNRLKELGFIAFINMRQKEIAVLLGPYENHKQADKSIARLKEIAHVQGRPINFKESS